MGDFMNVNQMIAELKLERESLTAAMSVLENIARSRGKRRGRPPAWLAGLQVKTAEPGPKRVVSAATRKKMALAQRKRWAKKGKAL
jgi:hypothetical protein